MKKLEEILSKKQFSFNRNLLKVEGEERLYDSIFLNANKDDELNTVTKKENVGPSVGVLTSIQKKQIQTDAQSTILTFDKISKAEEISIRQDIQKSISIKDKTSPIRQNKKQINKSILIQERKENRRDQILNIFIKDKEYSIKDIGKKVPGCSEKTVSRELENLVKENKLNRKGERRWARYFLD
jgi:Fic family protein